MNTSTRNRIRSVLYWILLVIRAILFPLAKIPFVLVILLLGFYALYINDQGQDLMAAFTAKDIFNNRYLFLFLLFLAFWAVSIWNVSRILLTAANLGRLVEKQISDEVLKKENIFGPVNKNKWVVASIDVRYKNALEFMIRWAPRILALMPYVIFIAAYNKQTGTFVGKFHGTLVLTIVIAFFHLLYMVYRKQIWAWFSKSVAARRAVTDNSAYSIEGQKGFVNTIKKSGVFINTILTVIMTIVMFVYAVWAANATPSPGGKPGLILLTGFTVYTLVGLLLNLIINWFRVPVFMLLVLFAVFFALKRNDNHTIQTIRTAVDSVLLKQRNAFSDSAYAYYWLRKKIADKVIDTDTITDKNIFIVAAEGGGSRNCYWTFSVLDTLQKLNKDFYDKTFAVTGVSGGSIGLGFYYNYRYYIDSLLRAKADTSGLGKKIDTICGSDYLSRVTYGFIFPDLVQRFIPWRNDSWDRSKMLANSFDDGFSVRLNGINTHFLSRNFLRMWSDTTTAYRYPIILFNSILDENGLKAIYSPFRLSNNYYSDAVDILYAMNRNVPMKEAMLSSARFPVLMAPGLIWRDSLFVKDSSAKNGDSVRMGHLSDGGGFENTGIQTAQQTALLLLKSIHDHYPSAKLHVKILYIGTGTGDISVDDGIPAKATEYGNPIGNAYEIAWLNGSLNTVFGWIKGSHNMLYRLKPDLGVLKFGLDISKDTIGHALPVGWYLSDSSVNRMKGQILKQNPAFAKSMHAFDRYR